MSHTAWNRIVPILNLLLFAGAAALYILSKQHPAGPAVPQLEPPSVEASVVGSQTIIQNESFDVKVTMDPQQPQAGTKTTVTLQISQNNQPVDIIQLGRIMQVAVVSDNLAEYRHLLFDSLTGEKGGYQFDYLFTQTGGHAIYVDINHNDMPDHHGDRTDLRTITRFNVGGTALEGYGAMTEPTWTHKEDGYTVKIAPKDLRTSELTVLEVTVTKDEDNSPTSFFLTDPFYTLVGEGNDGYTLEHFHTRQSTDQSLATQELEFRHAGRYLFWGFMYIDEGTDLARILQPKFLLDIEESEKTYEEKLESN